MSGDNEIRFFQMLKTISDNQNNFVSIMNTSNTNLSTQLSEFKKDAYNKSDKIETKISLQDIKIENLRKEMQDISNGIALFTMDIRQKQEDTEKRQDDIEENIGKALLKICDKNTRSKCAEWTQKEVAAIIDENIQKSINHKKDKKKLKDKIKENIIDLLANPVKWPAAIAMLGISIAGIYGLIIFFIEKFKP